MVWPVPCLGMSDEPSLPAKGETEKGMTNSKLLEFRIPADTRYVSLVRRGIRSMAEAAGFAREDVADMEVAVCEAVTNSVVHGSPDLDSAGVVVKCETCGDLLVVEIEDRSRTESLPELESSAGPHDESGRGVLMMRALTDEYEDSLTEHGLKVRMAKQKTQVGG